MAFVQRSLGRSATAEAPVIGYLNFYLPAGDGKMKLAFSVLKADNDDHVAIAEFLGEGDMESGLEALREQLVIQYNPVSAKSGPRIALARPKPATH